MTISRKEQIFQVAQNLFREKGYSATSMRDLASTIGIEPASLYSHIKSKEEILHKICFSIAEEFFTSIKSVDSNYENSSGLLRQCIIEHVKVITNNVDASAVFLHDWRFLSEPSLSEFISMRNDYEKIFRKIIKKGVRNNEFKDHGETFMVLTLFSSLNWTYEWYQPDGNLTPEEIGLKLSEIIIKGFKP